MKTAQAILIAACSVSLAGCVVGAKPKTATPPAPQPVAAPAPAPPPDPLSMPQTQVQLPSPQSVNPEAVAPAPAPEPAPEAPPAGRTAARPRPAAPSHTEPAAIPAVPPPPEPERGPVREVLPAAESKRLKDNADINKRAVRAWLTPTRARRHNPSTVARIQALLKASDDAEEKGDMREASDLADRAVIMLRELQSGK
jgi:hypothetical protein